MSIIDGFIFLLQTIIPSAIVLFFIVGLICLGIALTGLWRESADLNNLWIQPSLNLKKLSGLKERSLFYPCHLGLRIKALMKAAEQILQGSAVKKDTSRQEQDKNPVFPSLSDMHELTLHNESSRSCTAVMNTIISSLLICGILGTLVGVHSVIIAEEVDILKLRFALRPSMWAVGLTILLIFLRGFYSISADKYISRLDRFTLEKLLPTIHKSLQSNKEQSSELLALSKKITVFKDNSLKVQQQVDSLQEPQDKSLSSLVALSLHAQKNLHTAGDICSNWAEELSPSPPSIPPVSPAAPELLHLMRDETSRLQSFAAQTRQHLAEVDHAEEHAQKLIINIACNLGLIHSRKDFSIITWQKALQFSNNPRRETMDAILKNINPDKSPDALKPPALPNTSG